MTLDPSPMRRALLGVALLGLAGGPALAMDVKGLPDPALGKDLSLRLCSNCHLVAPDAEARDSHVAPPFAAIAAMPERTAERIAGSIIIPHPAMPTIQLTMTEIRDIVTYITSLKPADEQK